MAGHQQRLLFKAQAGAAIAQQPLINPESELILVGETWWCYLGLARVVHNSGHHVLKTLTVRNDAQQAANVERRGILP